MKILIAVILSCLVVSVYSQELSRTTCPSAGGSIKNKQGFTLEWTLGNQFSQVAKNNTHITEGFQQGAFQKKDKAPAINSKENQPSLNFKAFPNPATEQLTIELNSEFTGDILFILFDNNGREISRTESFFQNKSSLIFNEIANLSSGNYFIQAIPTNFPPSIIRFIKK